MICSNNSSQALVLEPLKRIVLLILCQLYGLAWAQTGGGSSYSFLDIPMTARAAALGGSNMSIWGDDVNLLYSNPALLNPSMHKQFALNYCDYVGDLNFWYLGYAHSLGKNGTAGLSMQ